MGWVHRIHRSEPWLAKYRGPDGRQHSRSFHRKVDAEKWTHPYIHHSMGREHRPRRMGRPAGGAIPFFDYAETWLDGMHELKPKTVNEYRWHLTSRVLPTSGDERLRFDQPSDRSLVAEPSSRQRVEHEPRTPVPRGPIPDPQPGSERWSPRPQPMRESQASNSPASPPVVPHFRAAGCSS